MKARTQMFSSSIHVRLWLKHTMQVESLK